MDNLPFMPPFFAIFRVEDGPEMPEMLERWGRELDQHARWTLGALIAFYAAVVSAQAALKLVWADELITYYVSQQPGFAGVWRALAAGTDPNPPLMHVLVKGSTAVLGGNAPGMRVPAMLCAGIALVAMWWMLLRWVRPVFALAGCLAFMATRGFDYAYDARSYAPMMGFAMVSLACWMRVGDVVGWRRSLALSGMALALAAGVSSNYYCVLAFFPIAVGEVIGRRFRWGVWVAMAVASLPLIAYLPLIRRNIAEFGPHAWNRPQVSMIAWSYLELVEGVFWVVAGLGVWVLYRRKTHTGGTEVPQRHTEMAAVGVLLGYPVIGFAIAVCGAGMVSPRCVAPVCCGFGLAAGLLASRVFGGSRRAGMAVVVLLVVWVGVREGVCAGVLLEQRRAFFALRDEVLRVPGDQILVGDSSFVLPLYYYCDDQNRRRIAFPIDFGAIHRFERDDSGEQNLWAGRDGVFPFRIGRMRDVLFEDPRGLVVVGRPDGWLARWMELQGVALRQYGEDEDWGRVGGVFTPMAHAETRIMVADGPKE
jgi:hypothetical protein